MRSTVVMTAALLGASLFAGQPAAQAQEAKRTVVYYQTQYYNGAYVSPKPLADNGVTDVLVAALHLNGDGTVHLNDHPPGDPRYTRMWTDLASMQARGVHVSMMVGGAAPGTFQRLDTEFDTYYPRLRGVISTYHLDGVDLDVEENMSLAGIKRVIDALRADFGSGFIITLAPVAPALSGGGNLSGFDYEQLERDRGAQINWYNAQFYCGWASLSNTDAYDSIIRRGLFKPEKTVASSLTHPSLCGGYVDVTTTLKTTIQSLAQKYPTFGGVAGWEYFTSNPGGTARPWEWAGLITSYLRGTPQPTNLALNKAATGSTSCNSDEAPAKAVNGSVSGGNTDKFCSLVSSKWLRVDLGASMSVGSFTVRHAGAGGESTSYNTRAFTIQTSTDGTTWTTRVTVTGNTANVTTHPITPVSARYLRLNITTPTQTSDPAARVYEFEAYA